MADLKTDAPLVFEGSVKSVGASNVTSVAADKKTAIVTVDHVRNAPRAMAGLAGKEITLRMAPGESLKDGDRFAFFADGLVYGDNLAVQSRGHEAVAPAERAASVVAAAPVVARLRRRIDDAQAVVSGRVVDVRDTAQPTKAMAVAAGSPRTRISEHDPFWQDAVIEVSDVHKGPNQKRVVVRFPSSTDVQWHKAPKFKKGQTGLWLLHSPPPARALTAAVLPAAALPRDVYTALDPNDYHPSGLAPVVEAMIQRRTPAGAGKTAASAQGTSAKKSAAEKTIPKKKAAKKVPSKGAAKKRR